ncbi:MAG: PhnD/SsuA/transferrin family substrate-binding protein [Opitutales bacterium]|nr:PhnD/SsuA/transferrin family substrate-binding protein [Opitutales bacterium]
MKSRFPVVLIALMVAIFVSGCGSGSPGDEVERFVVALRPDRDPDAMMEEKVALERFLRDRTGRPVEVIIPLSGAVIQEGLANGTIDVAFVSATEAVRAADAGVGGILLATEINGRPYYESYWITLREAPYGNVEDLRGRPIAFSSRTSTSGMQVPVWDMVRRGLLAPTDRPEAFFGEGNVFYGTGYVSAAQRVLNGQAAAAAVSYYVLDKDKHLSAEDRSRLRRLASQGPVPTHVLCVRTSLHPADRIALEAAFRALNEQAADLRDRMFTGPLIEVDEETHLAPTREILALLRSMPL